MLRLAFQTIGDDGRYADGPVPGPFNGRQLIVGVGSVHRTCLANGAVASMVIVQMFGTWDLWVLQTMLPARRAITSPSIV